MASVLGKIVKSNSHIDYVCQVYGKDEVENAPQPSDYGLGTFVLVDLAGGRANGSLVGLVYDTVLLNPDFGRLGPRLSPEQELEIFAPDYLNERAVLVGVTAIGHVDPAGKVTQGVPLLAASSDAQVQQMNAGQIRAFHETPNGLNLTYLPILLQQDNPLAFFLGRIVLDVLSELLPRYRPELSVLVDDLNWRTQIGSMGGMR